MPTRQPHPPISIPSKLSGMRFVVLGSLLVGALLAGCSSQGPAKFAQNSIATAGLSQSNFRIVKSNVRGDSYGFRLLGFIPIVPARVADAKEDLYQKLDRSGIRMEGRSIALANATEDENHYYFIIGSVPRITLTADIIEFLDDRGTAEKNAERARASEPLTGALVPSSILKPSALNSPPPSSPPAAPPAPAATKPTPAAPASSPTELTPIGDAPIAEFDIPPFGTQGKETGTVPSK